MLIGLSRGILPTAFHLVIILPKKEVIRTQTEALVKRGVIEESHRVEPSAPQTHPK